jgi:tetratricopeptide (TPR) repeat protein
VKTPEASLLNVLQRGWFRCGAHREWKLRLASQLTFQCVCRLIAVLVVLLGASPALAGDPRCPRLAERQSYGPFDYRLAKKVYVKELKVVEDFHFKRSFRRGAMRGDVGAWFEMDYTIRAFPNHAPALFLLGMLEHKLITERAQSYKSLTKREKFSPVSCYFERAIRFAPNDPNVYNAYGRLLVIKKQYAESIDAFKKSVELAPETASARYNLGLAYYAGGQYEEAAKAAREAYRLGYRRTELKDRLKRKGHW